MNPYHFIRQKKRGEMNDSCDIKEFVAGYMAGEVADYQVSAWLMAVCFNGLNTEELAAYTEALIDSGQRFDLSGIPGFKVDKHSTGGVGDKVSLILAPLVAACGVPVPMVSGRGLGHTGGTLDKLAAIPGFRTDLTVEEFKHNLQTVGVAMMGQTPELCPADGRIYALRDITGTVESIPLIAASISAKKIAEGANGLVLDVKVGSGAFMREERDAELLAKTIIDITAGFSVQTTAVLTDMNQPLGRTVGNALEVAEAIDCLKGEGPADLAEITLELAAQMLTLARYRKGSEDRSEFLEKMRTEARGKLSSGKGLDKFIEMVEIQGGDARIVDNQSFIPQACCQIKVKACDAGFIHAIDTYRMGMLAVELGTGRRRADDKIDPAVGFRVFARISDKVRQGEDLALVYSNDQAVGQSISRELEKCFHVDSSPIRPPEIIKKRIGRP
jgi:pyrimidine-nucleoside phosphorylase